MKAKTIVLIALMVVVVALIAAKGAVKPDELVGNNPPTGTVISQSAQLIEEARQKRQPVWLLFHSITCQPCIEMEAVYNALKPEFKDKVAFIEIDVNNPVERNLLSQYQLELIPTTYFLNAEGNITFDYVGVIPEEDMRGKLQALAEGK